MERGGEGLDRRLISEPPLAIRISARRRLRKEVLLAAHGGGSWRDTLGVFKGRQVVDASIAGMPQPHPSGEAQTRRERLRAYPEAPPGGKCIRLLCASRAPSAGGFVRWEQGGLVSASFFAVCLAGKEQRKEEVQSTFPGSRYGSINIVRRATTLPP